MSAAVVVGVSKVVAQSLLEAAEQPDALALTKSEQEAAALLRDSEKSFLGLVLGPELEDQVAAAQRLRQNGGTLALLFLCRSEDLDGRRAEVMVAPFLGQHVRCVPVDDPERLRTGLNAMLARAMRRSRGAAIEQSSNVLISQLGEMPRFSRQILLDRLLEEAPIGVAVLDPELRVVTWNPVCERITGVPEQQARNRAVTDLLGSEWADRLAGFGEDNQPVDETAPFARDDGLLMHLHCNLNRIDPQRSEGGFLCLLQDVTTRVQAQQQLLETRRIASLRDVVAGMAHELNTPIGICVTASSMLDVGLQDLRKALASEKLKRSYMDEWIGRTDEVVTMVEQNLRRAAELIKRFKQVATVPSEPTVEIFDLHRKVDEILFTLQPAMKDMPVEIVNGCPPGITLHIDPTTLWQVIANLTNNAMKYAFAGRENGRIEVAAAVDGDMVTLVVSDNGVGISPQFIDRIFDPFVTSSRGSRTNGGTGLGLYLVYQIVTQQWRGKIQVDTEPDQGARFVMKFPADPSVG